MYCRHQGRIAHVRIPYVYACVHTEVDRINCICESWGGKWQSQINYSLLYAPVVHYSVAVVDVGSCEHVAAFVTLVHDAFAACGAVRGLAPRQAFSFSQIYVWVFIAWKGIWDRRARCRLGWRVREVDLAFECMIVMCKLGGVGGRRIYAHMIVNIVVVRMDAETWLSRTTSNSRANLWHDGVDDNWACQHFHFLE